VTSSLADTINKEIDREILGDLYEADSIEIEIDNNPPTQKRISIPLVRRIFPYGHKDVCK
jgi:hypothetical protein